MRLSIATQNQLEAALAAWGPLALSSEMLRRFAGDFTADGVVLPWGGRLSRDADMTFTDHIEGEARYARLESARGVAAPAGRKTAIIPIVGPITPFTLPRWMVDFGIRVASLPLIVGAARAAANDPEVNRIVLAIHSPGGSVFGVAEAAAALREVGTRKTLVAGVSYVAASAAYWLASAAKEIVSEPSGLTGSIGVRMTHVDESKMLADLGLTVTELSRPESKTDISGFKPLSATARVELMRIIDASYSQFAADISASRHIDMTVNGEQYGRVHPAEHAKSIGLIDRVATFEALLGESADLGDLTSTQRARLALTKRK